MKSRTALRSTVTNLDSQSDAHALAALAAQRIWPSILTYSALLLVHTGVWVFLYRHHWVSAEENCGIENAQVLFILVGGAFFLVALCRHERFEDKHLFAALTFLCVTFVLRELDVQDFNLHKALTWLGSGMGRNLWLIAGWVVLFAIFLRHRRGARASFLNLLRAKAGILLVAAGAFLIASQLFDQGVTGLPKATARFYEELIEINGYLLILLSSLICAIRKLQS